MTTVLYEPGEYRLSVSGHANASDTVDPVCAGVSALAWTLADAATAAGKFNASLLVDEQTPKIEVQCRPDEKVRGKCRYMFEIVLGGLMLIAEAHPENVQIKIGG